MEGDSKTTDGQDNDRSPLLFSSDEEDDEMRSRDETVQSPTILSPVVESVKENAIDLAIIRETNRLNRLQELLQGVPPPPSITIPQMDCAEVLERWRTNKLLLDEAIKEKVNKEAIVKNNSMTAMLTEEDVRNLKWPDVKSVHFYDVYYNLGYCSDELDRLSQKLRERYVGAETSTWCNAVSRCCPNSAKKRKGLRNWGQVSPGSRLSHLARRRQTFSSAGLQQLTSASNNPKAGTSGTVNNRLNLPFRRSAAGLSERRCIMLDAKKNNNKKPTRESARKKGASATKQQKTIPEMKPAVQATKRALFQSPEEQRRPVLRPSASVLDAKDMPENRVLRSKRALWPSTSNPEISRNVNGKRLLDSDLAAVYQAKKVARSDTCCVRSSRSLPSTLSTNESDEGNKKVGVEITNNLRRSSNQDAASRVSEMSELHKRKLIWAVSQALRTEGVSSKHPDFRPCATALALHYDQVRREWTGPPPTSTSEHMLQVVSARVSEVVRSHRSRLVNSDTSSEVQNRLGEPPFRDASSSLNVRNRSGPGMERRIPSARKSLTFDNFDDSSSKSNKSSDAVQAKANKSDTNSDAKCDDFRTNAKRVSRSLFGAENEGSKPIIPKDSQPTKGLLIGEGSSSKTLNGSSEKGHSLVKDSSGESVESREKTTPSGRRRLKRQPDASPVQRRMTRTWTSTQKKESSAVESTDSSTHPPSHSDSGEPISGSASEGFPPADAPIDDVSASQLPDSPKFPALETKVITPILEATVMESSTSSKSKEGSVANGDLSFSGRIESLKPAEEEKENNISIDLGLATSTSACLLDLKEEEEGKGQDLTRWAEMATRSIKKENKHFSDKCLDVCSHQQGTSAEESLYPWIGQSQMTETDSQCPTKLYEKYKSIFDSSSQGGNS